MSDALFNGRRLRVLTVLDIFTRESLALHAGKGIRGEEVVAILESVTMERGLPERIRCDYGPEFVSRVLDAWVHMNSVALDFSRPGKPTTMPTSRRSTVASGRNA